MAKTETSIAASLKKRFSREFFERYNKYPRIRVQHSLSHGLEDTWPWVEPSTHPSYDVSPDPQAARELACWASNWCENQNAMSWDSLHVDSFYSIIASDIPWRKLDDDDRYQLTEEELLHVRALHQRAGGLPDVNSSDRFVPASEYTPKPYRKRPSGPTLWTMLPRS